MKNIGPNFEQELHSAGLSLVRVAWSSDGMIWFPDDVPEVDKDAVLAVYAAHDPNASPQPPSKEDRITVLQEAYDNDRDNLNKAWLAALIADGAEETERKTAIESQMAALDAQLETDILVVITED